jgi:hypothetical protein
MGDAWGRIEKGDIRPEDLIGVPRTEEQIGTGHGSLPDGSILTEYQRQKLMRFFHERYGRYPLTEFEFDQWLRDNW